MKSLVKAGIKANVQASKCKTREELGELMNDPTLDGKDENKVGRVQRKSPRRETSRNDLLQQCCKRRKSSK
jgi:hypothetical protein